MDDICVESSYWINTIIKLDDGTYLIKSYHNNSDATNWSSVATFEEVVRILREEYREGE